MPSGSPFEQPFPAFAYSQSRWTTFQRCPRAYYLRVYEAWRGWAAPSGSASWLAYRLKRATSVPAFIGSVMHDVLTTTVRTLVHDAVLPSQDGMLHTARAALNTAWQSARRTAPSYFDPAVSPRGIMLEEFLYGNEPTGAALQRNRDRVAFLVETLWHCDSLWEQVRAADATQVIVPAPFGSLVWSEPRLIAGPVTLFAAPDLVLQSGTDTPLTITDLKTGRSDGVIDQLLTYGVALADGLLPSLSVGPTMEGQIVALGDGDRAISRCGINAEDLVGTRSQLVANINVLAGQLQHPRGAAPLAKEAFRMRTDLRNCAACVFRGQCHPGFYPLTIPGAPQGTQTPA